MLRAGEARLIMAYIELKYGRTSIQLEYDEDRFDVLGATVERPALSDAEIGDRVDYPIDSAVLEDIVSNGESVLIVVPDGTRQTASGQVVNLLVRRLIANGTATHDIRIIFATGIHRKVTDDEKAAIVTPFIVQRIKTLDHDPRDLAGLVRVGETSGGIPVELNRAVLEHDHVVIVGGVTFHYFAGFTGGRKLICPGLASSRTISETHKLAFDCERKTRRDGVDTGSLDGNAVNAAFMEAVAKVVPAFAINTVVSDAGEAVDLYCGNWISSHRAACDAYAADHTIEIAEKRPVVVVSCGGYPFDINMIQAHKALDTAARACSDGGLIYFLAECQDGLGRDDFLKWFEARNSERLAEILCEKYQVNGQTAWSLLTKAERFDIRVITQLDDVTCTMMGPRKIEPSEISLADGGYILPHGAKFHII
jgi:nickel-dependent lactate racemase